MAEKSFDTAELFCSNLPRQRAQVKQLLPFEQRVQDFTARSVQATNVDCRPKNFHHVSMIFHQCVVIPKTGEMVVLFFLFGTIRSETKSTLWLSNVPLVRWFSQL